MVDLESIQVRIEPGNTQIVPKDILRHIAMVLFRIALYIRMLYIFLNSLQINLWRLKVENT